MNDIQCIRWLPQLLWDKMSLLGLQHNAPIKNKNRLGVIRLGGLGDFVLFMPALKAILNIYPESKYQRYLITDRNGAELIRLDNTFGQVELVEIDGSKFIHNMFYRAMILRMISRTRFDLVIDAALSRRIEGNDAIVRSSGSMAVGFRPLPDQICEQRLGNYHYNTLVDYTPYEEHEILRYFRLIGKQPSSHESLLPSIHYPRHLQKRDQFLVFPGAKFPQRRWPAERFAKVARFVHERTGWTPVAAGAHTDSKSISKMIESSPDIPWQRLQQQNIPNLCEQIASSRLVVTNDSGPMHLAPALKTMTVAIVPGAEFAAYPNYPVINRHLMIIHHNDKACFNCSWRCTKSSDTKNTVPCLFQLSFEDVVAELDDVLAKTRQTIS